MSMILKKRIVTTTTKEVYVGKPFNPNFDGNLLAWYDGDTLATDPANTWSDRSTNGYNLTLFNAPTIINNAINGHDALRFDGINQQALNANAAFIRNQPQTFYIVFKQITWTLNEYIIDNVTGVPTFTIQQVTGSPQLASSAGVNLVLGNNLPVNIYGIITCVFNGVNSEIRNNNLAATVGNAGLLNGAGLFLGANGGGTTWANIETAYLIIRDAADNTTIQNIFINYLKNRFAL